MKKGSCKNVRTPGGMRKLCRGKNGKVKFVKMSSGRRKR